MANNASKKDEGFSSEIRFAQALCLMLLEGNLEEAKTKGTPDDVKFVEGCIDEFWRSLKEHNLKINSPERTKQNESSTKRFVV